MHDTEQQCNSADVSGFSRFFHTDVTLSGSFLQILTVSASGLDPETVHLPWLIQFFVTTLVCENVLTSRLFVHKIRDEQKCR
jgi:hypothetical protein